MEKFFCGVVCKHWQSLKAQHSLPSLCIKLSYKTEFVGSAMSQRLINVHIWACVSGNAAYLNTTDKEKLENEHVEVNYDSFWLI